MVLIFAGKPKPGCRIDQQLVFLKCGSHAAVLALDTSPRVFKMVLPIKWRSRTASLLLTIIVFGRCLFPLLSICVTLVVHQRIRREVGRKEGWPQHPTYPYIEVSTQTKTVMLDINRLSERGWGWRGESSVIKFHRRWPWMSHTTAVREDSSLG